MGQSPEARQFMGFVRKTLKFILRITHGMSSNATELALTSASRKVIGKLTAEEKAAWQVDGEQPVWLTEDVATSAYTGELPSAPAATVTTQPSSRRRAVRAQEIYVMEHRERLQQLVGNRAARKHGNKEFMALPHAERYEFTKKTPSLAHGSATIRARSSTSMPTMAPCQPP